MLVLRPNSIMLSGRRQVRSWSQTCSELAFGLSSRSLAANYHELAGLRQVRNQLWPCLRPDSVMEFVELSRHVEIARTCSKLVADRFEAEFHYAIWSQTGPKLVVDLSQTCWLVLVRC